MPWRWSAEPGAPEVAELDRTFHTQGEAESWLGEFYPDLRAAGVRAVSLYEADRRVYGPMSLEPDVR